MKVKRGSIRPWSYTQESLESRRNLIQNFKSHNLLTFAGAASIFLILSTLDYEAQHIRQP